MVRLPLLLELLGNMCIAIVCFPGCDATNFEINRILINQAFFLRDQKLKAKNLNVWRTKNPFRMK